MYWIKKENHTLIFNHPTVNRYRLGDLQIAAYPMTQIKRQAADVLN